MTKLDGKAPTILTEHGARRLTARLRDALVLADDLLVQAYTGRAWEALGHESWEAYCTAELPELRALKMRPQARQVRVKALRDEGATIPEIVAATGSSLGSVHRDLVKIEGREQPPSFQVETAATETRWQFAARHVRMAGGKGLTCLEFEDAAKIRHGAASGAMRSAEVKGHVRKVEMFRDGYTVYLTSE